MAQRVVLLCRHLSRRLPQLDKRLCRCGRGFYISQPLSSDTSNALSRSQSVAQLVNESTKIPSNELTIEDWYKTSQSMTDSEAAKLLQQILANNISLSEIPSGEKLVESLKIILNRLETTASLDVIARFVHLQKFENLGYIARYAREKELEWLLEMVKSVISVRVGLLESGNNIVTAYYYRKAGLLCDSTSAALEARTLAVLDSLSQKSVVKILYLLAVMKQRSGLLGSLVYMLYRKPRELNAKHLSDLFYACAVLSIVDQKMLSTLLVMCNSSVLAELKQEEHRHLLYGMLVSIGKIRWYNPVLLDDLCRCISDPAQVPFEVFSDILTTCAVINHLPTSIRPAIPTQFQQASHASNSQAFLDIAWNLTVFGVVNTLLTKSLLQLDTVKELTHNKYPHIAQSNSSKLLNIITETSLTSGSDTDSKRIVHHLEQFVPEFTDRELNSSVLEMLLSHLSCDPQYIESNVWYPYGHLIDFRYLYDTETGKVCSPSLYNAPLESGKDNITPTMKWVAILLNRYVDMTVSLNQTKPAVARRRLAERQLASMGYTVIPLTEVEVTSDPDRERKKAWFSAKIQSAVD